VPRKTIQACRSDLKSQEPFDKLRVNGIGLEKSLFPALLISWVNLRATPQFPDSNTTSAEQLARMQSVAVKDDAVKVTPDEFLEGVMKIHKTLLIGLCATASFVGLSVPAVASPSANVSIYFRSAPPPSRYERVPAPRRGYVWINGYWDVHRNRHVWNKGHWERARPGHYYAQPTWVRSKHRWELQRGEWRRGDRDRDGIPNRYDRDRYDQHQYDHAPNRIEVDRDRDGVPNRVDRDRDGDGVMNQRDDLPDNPRRH